MSVLSDWLRDEWTKYAFTSDSMGTRPTDWYVALFDETDTEIDSAGSDANYARQSVTFAMDSSPPGRASNDAEVSFPAAETGADYTVESFGVFDASTGGNMLVKAPLNTSRNVVEGDVLAFNIGDLTVGAGVE